MRTFIRHPADIPVAIEIQETPATRQGRTSNVSYGGLAFTSEEKLEPGVRIRVRIEVVSPAFEAEACVTYCRQKQGRYLIGVAFLRHDDLFVARMVEQICHIQHYQRHVATREGRTLSEQEAASEWISKFARRFPRWGT